MDPQADSARVFARVTLMTEETENLLDTVADDTADVGEDNGAAAAIAAMGLQRMSLQELKEKPAADLVAFAESLEIENANAMRKQDMMFAILKALAEEGVEIFGS